MRVATILAEICCSTLTAKIFNFETAELASQRHEKNVNKVVGHFSFPQKMLSDKETGALEFQAGGSQHVVGAR